MALTTCPECEKQISEYALSCPNCGFQHSKKTLPKQKEELEKKGFHDSFDEKEEREKDEHNFHDSFDVDNNQNHIQKPKKENKKNNLAGGIALIVIVIALVYFFSSNSEKDDLAQYKVLSQVELISGKGKYADILIPSYSKETPKETPVKKAEVKPEVTTAK